jgi:hypothetical protein
MGEKSEKNGHMLKLDGFSETFMKSISDYDGWLDNSGFFYIIPLSHNGNDDEVNQSRRYYDMWFKNSNNNNDDPLKTRFVNSNPPSRFSIRCEVKTFEKIQPEICGRKPFSLVQSKDSSSTSLKHDGNGPTRRRFTISRLRLESPVEIHIPTLEGDEVKEIKDALRKTEDEHQK